jgi:hypothetical protein
MRMDNYAFWIGALLLWQLYATILVALSKSMDNEQKLRHIAIIWALPFLGALYARFALNQAEREAAAERERQAREKPVEEA